MSKIILITGANGGIGTKLCQKFYQSNWVVIGTDISSDCQHSFYHYYLSLNLTDPLKSIELINFIQKTYNKLDCIIHNAAIQVCKPIWKMELTEWDDIYNCNLRIIFLLVKYGIELLKESQGSIINIASVHSVVTSNNIAAYASSKAAIVGLTKNLAIELGTLGIRVNSISPGAIETDMLKAGLARGHHGEGDINLALEKMNQSHLLGKIGQPMEVAELAYFMTTQGSYITGANYLIDGGASIKLSTE